MNCNCSIVSPEVIRAGLRQRAIDYNPNQEILRMGVSCVECGTDFKRGARAVRTITMLDQGVMVDYMCFDCVSVQEVFFPYGHFFGCMWSALKQGFDSGAVSLVSDCIAKLAPRARENVCDLFESAGEGGYEAKIRG